MTRGTLIIFVKAPVAGRVKTRLARAIGAGPAAAVFRRLLAITFAAASGGPWRTILAIDPPGAMGGFFSLWPARFDLMPQASGDLGARLLAAMRAVGEGPVIVIGADAPGLRARHLRQAFAALGGADAVFGPATDGGFWLFGVSGRRPAPRLFECVRWSSPHALADARATLPENFRIRLLDCLRDVDEACDLDAIGPRSRARQGEGPE